MNNKKVILLYILDILKEFSDKDHLLTQKEIMEKLNIIYHINVDRKMIAFNIEILIDYGYDIIKGNKGGYYLNERDFDENEIKFLVDAVYSSSVITGNNAHSIIKKLYSSLSKYERKNYLYIHKTNNINRTINNNVFLNIEILNEAIQTNKQISFNYLHYNEEGKLVKRNNGKDYFVSPYYLIHNNSRYYLLCSHNYDDHSNYRIDLMENVKIIDKERKSIKEIKTLGENFDISKYINNHIYMFGDDVIDANIEIINPQCITYIKEWFSDNAKIKKIEDKLIANIKSDSYALFYWCLQYQEYIKVLEPQSLVDNIVKTLKESLNKYQ